jgi:aerobic-type carbon monoxide dehydrogenase small subunit (CoxS/CutS family)
MIMNAYALLLKNPRPSRPQIVAGMEDNLCRCAAHHRIVQAIEFKLNGTPVPVETDGERRLLWVLRTDLGLTGTKFGCGESLCGACTVVIGKEAFRSCLLPVKAVRGKDVTTIEGLEKNGKLHPLQEAFADTGGLQCGFCTPGMIMNAYALLLKNPKPSRPQIVAGMEDNLCRCAAHHRIVQAIEKAAAGGAS